MNLKKLLPAAAAIIMAAMLCACSGEQELLSTVPADCGGVAVVNVKAVMSNMGCTFDGDGITLPAGINARRDFAATLRNIALLNRGADLSCAVIAAESGSWFATLRITDSSTVLNALGKAGIKTTGNKNGYEIYSGNGLSYYISDHQGWVCPDNAQISPKELLSRAKKESFRSKLQGVCAFLDANNMVSIAATASGFGLGLDSPDWTCVEIHPDGNNLVLNTRRMTAAGELVANTGLRQLNPDVLKLFPANAPLVGAAGIKDSFDWSTLAAIGGMLGGFQTMGMIESIVPYLEKTDGTIALAATPRSSDAWDSFSITAWNFLFAAQMPEPDALKAVDAVKAYLKRMMFPIRNAPNGFLVDQGELSLAVFTNGNMICIRNGNPNEGATGPVRSQSDAMLQITLPKGVLTRGSDIRLAIDCTGTNTAATLSLPQYNLPFLQALLTDITL